MVLDPTSKIRKLTLRPPTATNFVYVCTVYIRMFELLLLFCFLAELLTTIRATLLNAQLLLQACIFHPFKISQNFSVGGGDGGGEGKATCKSV